MPSLKTIKRRRASVSTTKKIMKAMDMVAASKLQKAKVRLDAARVLYTEAKRMVETMNIPAHALHHFYLQPRPIKSTAYIVITSDRGLCGGYNTNIASLALSHMKDKNEKILAVGLRGADYFRRREKNILQNYAGVAETAFYEDAESIANYVSTLFVNEEIDEAYVAYTHFQTTLSYLPSVVRILPVDPPLHAYDKDGMKYEPNIEEFLHWGIPVYIGAFLYNALAESAACEQASRMFCMDSAVNNASDIIEKLTRMYNRKRQSLITQEISEIVGSTNMVTSRK